ncbi:hypothetical protein AB2939_004303 [Escherichia coli]|uniref:hypothetical protein n=1 Tax=Enterobacteriaceae TaxID=543 RepID=UPI001562033C|nr:MULTISPECIES: hypothetical protein [Enterobacteriaceae]EGG3079916.1 hypothetical protein [Salmonella enterica]EFO7658918.1 hypothetical protein [Escherichia coli]EJY7028197.1 hypothetical protein [Escherichia coli]MDM3343648.1 hypothetical protein [Citrobacter sp. Cf115]MEB2378355.1 hypothetical protein [Citrobacter freundii]
MSHLPAGNFQISHSVTPFSLPFVSDRPATSWLIACKKPVWQGGGMVTPDGVTLLRPRCAAGLPAAPPLTSQTV